MPISRDKILTAIRETAKANGGVPLGQRLFFKQSGIKESDWRGRYWARWGDAVAEAGFTANKSLDRVEDTKLFIQAIPLIRRLQKCPTFAEIQLERRSNPNSISARSVSKRFGTIRNFYKKFAEYVAAAPELRDVLEFLNSEEAEASTIEQGASVYGFVYLIKSGSHFKIGKSDDIERRIKEIKVSLPEAATLLHSISTDDPSGIEAYWHRRFADRRANGEWFALTASDVAVFRRRKFQ